MSKSFKVKNGMLVLPDISAVQKDVINRKMRVVFKSGHLLEFPYETDEELNREFAQLSVVLDRSMGYQKINETITTINPLKEEV